MPQMAIVREGLRLGGRGIADDVEGTGGAVGPAGIVDGSEGGLTIAGVGSEGDAIEGVDVRCPVWPQHLAVVGGRWRRGNVGASGAFDPRIIDVVGML